MKIGNAPCVECNWHNFDIPLTGYSEPAEDGGTWWEICPNQKCESCGTALLWLHIPAPDSLIFGIYQDVELNKGDSHVR